MEETMQRWAQKIISTLEASIVQSDQRTNELIAKLHDIRVGSAYHGSPVGNQPCHPAPSPAPSSSPKLAFQPSNPIVHALQPPYPAPISPPTPPPIAAPLPVATPLPIATPPPMTSPPPIAAPPPMASPPPIATPPPATPPPIVPPPPLMTSPMPAPAAPVDPSTIAGLLIGKPPAANPHLSPPDLLSARQQIRRSSSPPPPLQALTSSVAAPSLAAPRHRLQASPTDLLTPPSPSLPLQPISLTPPSPSLPLQPISLMPPSPSLPAPLSDPPQTIFLASRSSRLHDRSAGYRLTGDLLHRSNLEPPGTPFPATDPPRLLLHRFHLCLQPPWMPALATDLPLLLLRHFDRRLYRKPAIAARTASLTNVTTIRPVRPHLCCRRTPFVHPLHQPSSLFPPPLNHAASHRHCHASQLH